jgi:peroxiredoxin
MRHLQKLHTRYESKGLVILGFNFADDKQIALEFLRENEATFPTILDSSDAATKIAFQDYRASGVPVNYVIDREGKVVDAWYGYEKGHPRAKAALAKAGLDMKASPKPSTKEKSSAIDRIFQALGAAAEEED